VTEPTRDHALGAIFDLLRTFRAYPKYALERRADIFLAPFLEPVLSSVLERRVELVVPEFPLRNLGETNHSTNVDYLMRVHDASPNAPGDRGGWWLLVELKTDAGSVSEKQARRYLAAKEAKMPALLADVATITEATTETTKYEALRQRLDAFCHKDESGKVTPDEVRILYLGPGARPTCAPFGQRTNGSGPLAIDWLPLERFFDRAAPAYPELWKELKQLLVP
jgi:hypothetical protein